MYVRSSYCPCFKELYAGAEVIDRYALAGLQKTFGTHYLRPLRISKRHADLLCLQRQYNDAAKQLSCTREAQEERLGLNHPDTLSTVSSLGVSYVLQGYDGAAKNVLEDAHNRQK